MTKKIDTLFLLILEDSQNDAEKLTSLLRNAGIATRAKFIRDEDAFNEALASGPLDLFIARESVAPFDLQQACKTIKQKDLYVPMIVIADQYDENAATTFLQAGIHDVVSLAHHKHLVAVVKRELEQIQAHKKLRHLEVEIRDVEHRCELLLDSSKDAIAYINDGMHVYANASYLEFLGYEDIDEMICIPVMDTLETSSHDKFKQITRDFQDQDEVKPVDNVALTSLKEDGSSVPVHASFSHASFDGEPCMQIILSPEKDQAELEEKIREMSQIDLLTGLYNRAHFMDVLNQTKDTALKNDSKSAVLYLAIDRFNEVSANLGMGDADLVLRDLAQLFKGEIAERDTLARLSDDVFGAVIVGVTEDAAVQKAEAIRAKVEEHLFDVEGKTVQITLSIGINIVNKNAPDIKEILGRAQSASLDVTKLEGKENGNGVKVFELVIENPLGNHDTALDYINQALTDNKFKLLFQPIQSLRGSSLEHYEVFARMIDDKGEDVSPYDFLPPNGPTEIAPKVDKWVILQSIKLLNEHRAKGNDTRLFINLTAETLQDSNFVSWLNVALKAARLPGDALIFQVTESSAITYLKQIKEFEKGLKTLHCSLSVNHFGSAINPFNLLKHVSPDYLKLDGSYTEDLKSGEEGKESLKEMIQTLQSMDKTPIVPLVESASLLASLWQVGATYIQGYYLQAPSPEMNYDFSGE